MMAYRNPDLFGGMKRLDWNKLPHINYYGKKYRGKKRKYYGDEYEEDSPKVTMKNGYYFVEESPFSKAISSIASSKFSSPPPEKETRSLGVQAILLRSSHQKREEEISSDSEKEVKHKKKKKKVKKLVIKKMVDVDTQNNEEIKKDQYNTLDLRYDWAF